MSVKRFCSWTGVHYSGMAIVDCMSRAANGSPYCAYHRQQKDEEKQEQQADEERLREEGRLEEREACAKIIEAEGVKWAAGSTVHFAVLYAAASIRARGTKPAKRRKP